MTPCTHNLAVEKIYWPAIRERIIAINQELATILDSIKLELPFYIAKYPFGATIIEEGIFFLPQSDGTTKNCLSPDIPVDLRKDLDYLSEKSTPIGIVLTHSSELYLQREGQHIPWILMTPGRIFGLWRTLDREFPHSYHNQNTWYMKAGLQHGFILPKITIASAYKKLALARGLSTKSPPRDLYEQCFMLQQISHSERFLQSWHTEVLYFSRQWLDHLQQMPQLELFLYKTLARQSRFWRNGVVYNFMWDSFIAELKKESMFFKPYIIDIVKHILMVALGALPSFVPAMDDTSAPIQGIQQDFLDIYGLKAAPVIMVPTHFDMYDPDAKPVYWSLQFPCYLESVPNPKTRGSNLDDLSQIAHLIEYLFETVQRKRLAVIINTPIEYCLQHIQFEFFHSDALMGDSLIRPSREMPLEDPRLVHCIVPGRENEVFEFSEVSPFVRGCVRFSLRQS